MKNYTIVREELWIDDGFGCGEDYDVGVYFINEEGNPIEARSEFDGCYEPREFGTKEDALEFILEQNGINVEYKE